MTVAPCQEELTFEERLLRCIWQKEAAINTTAWMSGEELRSLFYPSRERQGRANASTSLHADAIRTRAAGGHDAGTAKGHAAAAVNYDGASPDTARRHGDILTGDD